MSGFSPVFLPPDRALNDRASLTLLRHFNLCARSAFLYQRFKGEASTPPMARGKAGHRALEHSIRAAVDQGEPMIPGDLVKVITDEVLCEEHVPIEEHDVLREAVYRWASEFTVDPSAVVALETLFVLDVDGFQVRCRIDLAQLLEDGAAVRVEDWKFQRGGVPAYEDFARRRPDGSLSAKSMQLVTYALALAFGVPVREEPCDWCSGKGYTVAAGPGGTQRVPCRKCGEQDREGRGVIEIPEPFPVAARAQRFDMAFVYPTIEDKDGRMVRREASLSRLELEEYLTSLRGLVTRLRESERSGDWPAVVSDEACSICPAASLCPIPAELRDHRGTLNTVEEFAETMARLEREEAEMRARKKEAREFVKAHGGSLGFGGKVAELVYSESEQITDRDGLFEAIERAVRFGEPFDRSRFVKVRGSTRFVTRDVAVDEVAEEAAPA